MHCKSSSKRLEDEVALVLQHLQSQFPLGVAEMMVAYWFKVRLVLLIGCGRVCCIACGSGCVSRSVELPAVFVCI